jgi:triosephosphate isomerase
VRLGVQNVYWEAGGAFTGELSVPMAAEAGAEYVLIGHSERRHVFGETVTQTVRKVRAVLDGGLVPLLCVGETLDERRAGRAEAVVEGQLVPVLATLTRRGDGAPGGGVRAGVGHRHRRDGEPGGRGLDAPRGARAPRRACGPEGARAIPILYGGSVKPENAASCWPSRRWTGCWWAGRRSTPAASRRSARRVDNRACAANLHRLPPATSPLPELSVFTFLLILLILDSFVLIPTVLLQSGKGGGLASMGGAPAAPTRSSAAGRRPRSSPR